MTVGRIITCDADVAEGAAWLAATHPRFADALQATGPLPLRLRADGFDALIGAIISQQVSVASANAMRAKMDAQGLTHEAAIVAAGEDGLRDAGLSRQKIRYALALAQAGVDYAALRDAPDAQVIKTLTAIPGVGSWTAQIYAMFSLGRADVFAEGDLALQEAAKVLFDLPERPKPKALALMAEDWSPWRSVAARALFSYYRVVKQREGIT
ncbi:DNA-3-methyladenine glycosylase [Sulfitobacter sp. HGT1]|uniref:DNA-3-methyladenine glycosylase family protein n=1 Tax=Sulfitobacter sp. HGT1 TaxID=2735435 RepID=UPI001594648D|nr:DNA-3-methyladenine glycosylase 2 family protein [Sulfitobacter sp. HGT1]